jgi:hypothetical protein
MNSVGSIEVIRVDCREAPSTQRMGARNMGACEGSLRIKLQEVGTFVAHLGDVATPDDHSMTERLHDRFPRCRAHPPRLGAVFGNFRAQTHSSFSLRRLSRGRERSRSPPHRAPLTDVARPELSWSGRKRASHSVVAAR